MDYTNSHIHSTLAEQLHQAHNLLVNIAREITVSGYSDRVQTQAAERLVTTLEKVYGSVGQYMCYQSAGEDEFKIPESNKIFIALNEDDKEKEKEDEDEDEEEDDDEDKDEEQQVVNANLPLVSSQTPRLSLRLIEDNLRRPVLEASTPSSASVCSKTINRTSLFRRKPVPVRNRGVSRTSTRSSWETLVNNGYDDDFNALVEPLNIKKRPPPPDLRLHIPESKGNPVICVYSSGVPREDSPVLGRLQHQQ